MDRFKSIDLHVMSKPDHRRSPTPTRPWRTASGGPCRGRGPRRHHRRGDGFGQSGQRWVIDPIDGTKNFVRGVPVWATLISLVVDEEVVLGVVSAPSCSAGGGRRRATAPGPVVRCSRRAGARCPTCRLEDASLSRLAVRLGPARDGSTTSSRSPRCWRTRAYGDFWSYMLLAEGAVDLAAEPELEVYDMAALDVIVREAGGRFTSSTAPTARSAATRWPPTAPARGRPLVPGLADDP